MEIDIQKIIEGDTREFAKLVDNYKQMVFSICVQIVQSKEVAEEISQDVFLKVYRSLISFKNKSKLSTWIYKIAYHTAISKVKGKKLNILETEDYENLILDTNKSPSEHLNQQYKNELIKKALSKLMPNERILINLYYFEEFKIEEIREITNLTLSNIKTALYRIRKKLKSDLQFLEHELFDDNEVLI